MVDLAAQQSMRAHRIEITDGKIYAQISKSSRGQNLIWYWLCGLVELINDFPTEDIPKVDFVLNTQDDPLVPVVGKRPKNPILAKKYCDYVPGIESQALLPLFSAVTNSYNYDLLWPFWTIWGENVEGARSKAGGLHDPPWKELHPKLIQFATRNKWLEFDAADVQHKLRKVKPIGALDRVMFKYLIYLNGKSFSSAILPMLKQRVKSRETSQNALDWAETQLSTLAFQKYMIAMLKRYAKLLKYAPIRTKNTVEILWKILKKNVKRKQ
ncbi:unnamed protein product [Bathycoccus prasinos]